MHSEIVKVLNGFSPEARKLMMCVINRLEPVEADLTKYYVSLTYTEIQQITSWKPNELDPLLDEFMGEKSGIDIDFPSGIWFSAKFISSIKLTETHVIFGFSPEVVRLVQGYEIIDEE